MADLENTVKHSRTITAISAAVAALGLLAAAARAEAAQAVPAPPAAEAPAAAPIQISGRVIYTWYEKDKLRVFLAIDGFRVVTAAQQIRANDGIVWFDEAEAERTGHAALGVYAETNAEVHGADGSIRKYDSVYVPVANGQEVRLQSDLPLRGEVESAPLYLRAKKRRQEFLEGLPPEQPTSIVPPPAAVPVPRPPGAREAGVPQEINVVPRDDTSKVNFTSTVEDGMRVGVWTGGVYVVRGSMEMAADNVVIWTPEEAVRGAAGRKAEASGRRLAAEAYFEGNVHITVGQRQLFSDQLYYDFEHDTALALHARIETFSKARDMPVYYYAKELRQLAQGVFAGKDAWVTTDQFGVPNYDIGASELTLIDLTPERAEPETGAQYRRVRFVGKDVEFRVRRMPLSWWPRMAGDLSEGATALRTVRIENSTDRGVGLVTQWHLAKLLGLEREPEGFNTYLDLDFWSKRGPAVGLESKYARQNFYGQFLSYYLRDAGKDSVGSQDVKPSTENRGWVRWLHRQYLPSNWELTMELSYVSDAGFLNEFFERQDREEKAQETLVYLKRQMLDASGLPSDQALTILLSKRLNDFYTRTEFLPQIGYNIIGHSLLNDRLTYFQDSEIAFARYQPDDRLGLPGSNGELVADTIHEVDLPLRAGPVDIVPFTEVRLSYFEKDINGRNNRTRLYWRGGARAAVQAWRLYTGAESGLLDIHGIRHINTFDVSVYHAYNSIRMEDLIPYDVTEAGTPIWQGVSGIGVTEVGWRQRFQTKRGPPGKSQVVDWLTLDLEGHFYDGREGPAPIAPDGRLAFNRLDLWTDCRVTDSTRLWSDTNYNADEGTLEFFAVGLTVLHPPRLSYSVGHRLITDEQTARTYISADYQINEKWRITLLEQFDFERIENAQTAILLTRRMNKWLVRLRFEVDPAEDNTFFGIEFQPLGVPELRFGL